MVGHVLKRPIGEGSYIRRIIVEKSDARRQASAFGESLFADHPSSTYHADRLTTEY